MFDERADDQINNVLDTIIERRGEAHTKAIRREMQRREDVKL